MASTITDRISGLSTSTAVKAPVRVATTANIALSGLQTIDGVELADGDRVLVKNQSSAVDNGIYVAHATSWERAKDFDGARDATNGTVVLVRSGTANADQSYRLTTANPVLFGSSSITWERIGFGSRVTGQVVVETVDELRLMTAGSDTETALVLGESVVGDGGGGIFRYSSTDAGYCKSVALTAQGSGYTTASITVTGDGTGMKLIPIIEKEIIRYIVIADVGRGYTTATGTVTGDGSGATVSITLTQDDGGILVRPDDIDAGSPGRWRRQIDGEINAKWFGATGDGSTDDTTALQAFIDACFSWSLPGFIPAGVYRITDGLSVPTSGTGVNHKGLKLRGAGKRATYIRSEYEGYAFSLIGGGSGEFRFQYGTKISDIAFVASEFRKANTEGVYIRGLWYATFDNVAAREFGGNGFYVDNTTGDSDSMTHGRFIQCDAEWNGDHGFEFDGTGGISMLTLQDCLGTRNQTAQAAFEGVGHCEVGTCSFNGQDRTASDYDGVGVIIGAQCRGISFSDCELGNAVNPHTVVIEGGTNISFRLNRFLRRADEETNIVGVKVTGGVRGLEVVQNTVLVDTNVTAAWNFVELPENAASNSSIVIRDNHIATLAAGNSAVPVIHATQVDTFVIDYDDARGVVYRYRPRKTYVAEPLSFSSGGTYEIQAGDTITGATSSATADVVSVTLASGSWAAGTAAGVLTLESRSGTFQAENLDVGANSNVATASAAYAPDLQNGTVHVITPATASITLGTPTRLGNFEGIVMHVYIYNDAAGTLSGTIATGSAYVCPDISVLSPDASEYAHLAFIWVPALSKWLWIGEPTVSG